MPYDEISDRLKQRRISHIPMTRFEKAKFLRLLRKKWSNRSGSRDKKGHLTLHLDETCSVCIDSALFHSVTAPCGSIDSLSRYLDVSDSLRTLLEEKFKMRNKFIEGWNRKQSKRMVIKAAKSMPVEIR